MNDSNPTVSVILPTYNRASMLKRAVDSVLKQTYTDYELIIINDRSTDGTEDIVKSYDDKRIRCIKHDQNKGGSAARNTGIKSAKGTYIAFLDDDDEWMPQKLEKQVEKIEQASETVGLVYAGSEVRMGDEEKLWKVNHPKWKGNLRGQFQLVQDIGGIPVLIKRKCFEKIGLFDETLTSCQDWDMWKRFSEYYEFDYVPDILTKVYLHDDQLSTNYESLIKGRTRMVQKYYDDFGKDPSVLVIHLKRIGKMHCLNGTYKEALHWFKKAVNVRRLEIIKIVAWCVLELPILKLFARSKTFKKYKYQ